MRRPFISSHLFISHLLFFVEPQIMNCTIIRFPCFRHSPSDLVSFHSVASCFVSRHILSRLFTSRFFFVSRLVIVSAIHQRRATSFSSASFHLKPSCSSPHAVSSHSSPHLKLSQLPRAPLMIRPSRRHAITAARRPLSSSPSRLILASNTISPQLSGNLNL